MKRKSKSAFTLAELLITLGIILVLLCIAVPVLTGLMNKGNDTSEDVNAAFYTTIMNKFAAEDVNKASSYPRLSTTGTNSEYAIFSSKAGNGTYPGYNIIAGLNSANALDMIRREAVIAIKAFSDTAVSDEYYISPPADADYEYVYYYLTGEVKKMKRDDMTTTSDDALLNGNIDIKDYWVYLSRDGGSGAALGGVSEGKGFLFVQVLQYGTGQPIDGATVTVRSGASTYTAITEDGQNGYVGFAGIPIGSVQVSVEKHGAIAFPNSRYYSKTGEIIISESGYEGCQLNIPYVVDLKIGSLGSLGFYEENVKWENGSWTTERNKITDNINITSKFVANTSNPGGVPRNETYITNLYATGGTQQLLDGDKFLTYGNYNLSVTSYSYRTYLEAITSGVFGIDNASGTYSGFTSPYEYPIVMKYPSGQSVVSGTVERESSYQPLEGTASGLSGTWGYSNNSYVYARVKLTNTSTHRVYYSDYFSYDSEGKHDYVITDLPDGTYTFTIESPYKHSDLSEFPDTVTIDGRHVEVSGKVYRSEVGSGSIDGYLTYDYSGGYDPIPGATVFFTRYGDSSSVYTTTDSNGYYDIRGLDCGFYQMTVSLPSGLGGYSAYFKMFISGDERCDVTLSIPTVRISGYIEPYRNSYTPVYKRGTLGGITISFTRTNSTGSKTYSTVYAYASTSGIDASYSVDLVPGYYYMSYSSLCYQDVSEGRSNFTRNTTKNGYIYIDTYNEYNHAYMYLNYDAYGHWDECSNCEEVFNYSEHDPSYWTYYSTSYCYRYCTVCGYITDGPSSHTMSSYVSRQATCTTPGIRVYYCTKGCGYSYSEEFSGGGHTCNGIWVYDENGTETYVGTHHQNCSGCGIVMDAGTHCSRGSWYSDGQYYHYDVCSVCHGKRYSAHKWEETSRTGYVCTGGTVYYRCYDCGATKTGTYEATSAHNMRASCDTFHDCSWNTECTAQGLHVWDGYYHIMCTRCREVHYNKWCAMHMGGGKTEFPCPY